jgi:hypothetical protein
LVGHGNIVSNLVSDGLFDVLVKAAEARRRKQERANKMILSLDHEPPISVDAENVFEASVALIMLRIGISEAFGQYFQQPQRHHGGSKFGCAGQGPKMDPRQGECVRRLVERTAVGEGE